MCSMSSHPSPLQPSLPAGANPTLSCLAWILIGRLHQMGGRRCRPVNGGSSPGAANCWERRRRKGGRPVLSNEELEHPPVGWKVGLSFLGSVSLPLTKHDRMSWLGPPPPSPSPPQNHHTHLVTSDLNSIVSRFRRATPLSALLSVCSISLTFYCSSIYFFSLQ